MVKKIPKRKHRGVRDPVKQREQRDLVLKDKINRPPKNKDDQEVPKRLQYVLEANKSIKDGTFRKFCREQKIKNDKAQYKLSNVPNKNKPYLKKVPKFKRKSGESNDVFLRRVNNLTHSVIMESKFEQKYNVDIVRNPDNNDVLKVEKHVDVLAKQRVKPKLSKRQRYNKRKRERKLNENVTSNGPPHNNNDEPKYEFIKFGEVVQQPPNIKIPKNSKFSTKVQQNKQTGLLLSKNLEMHRNEVVQSYKKHLKSKYISDK